MIAFPYKFRCRRAKVLQVGITEILYWKVSRNTTLYHKPLCQDLVCFYTSWACEAIFKVGEGYLYTLQTQLCDFFHFTKTLSSYLVVITGPNSQQALGSAISQYLNKRTMKHFRNGLRDGKYVFKPRRILWKDVIFILLFWFKHFWDIVQYTLFIEQPSYASIESKI